MSGWYECTPHRGMRARRWERKSTLPLPIDCLDEVLDEGVRLLPAAAAGARAGPAVPITIPHRLLALRRRLWYSSLIPSCPAPSSSTGQRDALRAVRRDAGSAGQAARRAVPRTARPDRARRRGRLRCLLPHRTPLLPGVLDLVQPAGADRRRRPAHPPAPLPSRPAHPAPGQSDAPRWRDRRRRHPQRRPARNRSWARARLAVRAQWSGAGREPRSLRRGGRNPAPRLDRGSLWLPGPLLPLRGPHRRPQTPAEAAPPRCSRAAPA